IPTKDKKIVSTKSLPQSTTIRKKSAFKPPFKNIMPENKKLAAEIKSLEARVKELETSIRHGLMVKKFQEEEDTPLEELIKKWTKVSQEAALSLVEKMPDLEFEDYQGSIFNSNDPYSLNRNRYNYLDNMYDGEGD